MDSNLNKLDEIDLEILKILKEDARISAKAIASKVNVSAPTVSARIDAMVKNNIIRGFHTDISPIAFGKMIKAYINMEVSPKNKEELYSFLQNCENVAECHRVTGDYSLLIKVYFKDTDEMDSVINKLQHFGRTETQIVFSTIIETH